MAVSISFYNQFMEYVGDNGIDLDTDTFKAELYNSTHTFTAANTNRSQVSTNALATNFGYTNPGQNLATVTWVSAVAVQTFDAADTTWTAAGGSIGPARHCLIYSDTATVPFADLLMCDIDFGVDETAGDGTDFKVTYHTSGIFTVS